ncbi:hypothetical protein DBA29_20425 [Xenophilus aerolatus]|nr:hypothetical protein [Xenophilus aerolatus]
MAQEVALTIDQGSQYVQPFKFFADEGNTDILDLSGASAAMQFKRDDYDGAVVLALTSASGLVIDAAQGTITATITAAQTAAIKVMKGDDSVTGRYDLEIEVGGVKKRVLQGDFTITREVTTI